jgi:hypothetical protein
MFLGRLLNRHCGDWVSNAATRAPKRSLRADASLGGLLARAARLIAMSSDAAGAENPPNASCPYGVRKVHASHRGPRIR